MRRSSSISSGESGDALNDGFGSAAPVQMVTELSVAQLTQRLPSPTTAPPLIAVTRTIETGRAEKQLVGRQREFVRRRRSAATAAEQPTLSTLLPAHHEANR